MLVTPPMVGVYGYTDEEAPHCTQEVGYFLPYRISLSGGGYLELLDRFKSHPLARGLEVRSTS